MLIYSMSTSIDGFIADREGDVGRSVPSEEQCAFHVEEVRGIGSHLCGRRLYETMVVWETDPSLRDSELGAAFADAWPAQAMEQDLVDELRIFRNPVLVGGGTAYLPPVTTRLDFDLVETRTFANRVVCERYRRARG